MKDSLEALAAKLEKELGAVAVRAGADTLRSHAVDGKEPSLVCFPGDPAHVGSVLRVCGEAEASVIPWGGGTAIRLGNIPRRVGVVIGLERLNGVMEHDDVNLTATALAGTKVAAFQEILKRKNQLLAIDPARPEEATLGGTVAANTNGPRRNLYGGVRDLVIGMKMVLASGVEIKAGGKVVKNVAGYDMCKLFVGSLGTLGIITELTFKMAPVPESGATFVAQGPLAKGIQLAEELFGSMLLPAAVTIVGAGALKADCIAIGVPAVAVWIEGFEESVARHLRDLQEMAGRIGLATRVLRGEPHRNLWEKIRDFGMEGEGVLYRVTVPLSAMADVVARIDQWSSAEGQGQTIGHPFSGTVWVLLDNHPSSVSWFARLAALAREHGGHAVMAAGPPAFKAGLDVWGPPPPGLPIMREIKRQFDPQGILNPGRFLAGL